MVIQVSPVLIVERLNKGMDTRSQKSLGDILRVDVKGNTEMSNNRKPNSAVLIKQLSKKSNKAKKS